MEDNSILFIDICRSIIYTFNLIPRDLRDTNTGTVDQFKFRLDYWLATVPDQPTIQGRQRAASTNSLLDQVLQIPS